MAKMVKSSRLVRKRLFLGKTVPRRSPLMQVDPWGQGEEGSTGVSGELVSLLLLLLLSHLSRVRLCASPQMAAHQPAVRS